MNSDACPTRLLDRLSWKQIYTSCKKRIQQNLYIQGTPSGYVLSKTHIIQPLFKGNPRDPSQVSLQQRCPSNRGNKYKHHVTIFLFQILCPLIINGGVPKESFHYCSVLKEAFLDISSSKCAFPSRKKSQLMILRSGL